MMQPCRLPRAVAHVRSGKVTTNIRGVIRFRQNCGGVLVTADVAGLPHDGFYALHIHDGGNCGGEDFSESGSHYDPNGVPHPNHAGDLPPLLSSGGKATMSVLTGRFRVDEIIGKTVIIHSGPDDFTSQPSGNAGEKIACGIIRGDRT